MKPQIPLPKPRPITKLSPASAARIRAKANAILGK